MKLQIKSLSGGLNESEKQYLRKKLLWLEERLPNSAILTVGVKENITKRSNQAIELFIHLSVPKLKKPIYVKVYKNSFTEAVDLAKDKVERIVVKHKEKGSRFRVKMPKLRVPKIKFKLSFRRKKELQNEQNPK